MEKRNYRPSNLWLGKALKPTIILIAMLALYCQEKNTTVSAKESMDPRHVKGQRLRAPQPLENLLKELQTEPEGGLLDSTELGDVVGPFIGNAEMMLEDPRRKKSCGMSPVAARAIMNRSLKRSYFATTPEEMATKQEEDGRQKREAKRSDFLADGPLPWSCETDYKWKDMGPDHYPRFVRTAECKQPLCFNGFFRCKPRRYKTKVLRRLTGAETASCEDDDVSLPESLRNSWKFITVTINLCCDCSGRLTPTASI